MPSEKVQFDNGRGQVLAARLELPDGTPDQYAVFAHCFTCSKDNLAASRIARSLADRGIGVLRFDFTGLGASQGEFANENFSSNVEDLVAAAEHLTATRGAPSLLIGHSLGGAAVLAAAGRLESIKAVATIAAPSGPDHVTHLFKEDLETIRTDGQAAVRLFGRDFTVSRQFVEDVQEARLLEDVRQLRKALLVFHAPLDDIVGIDNASRIFAAARHPKSFVSLDGADHLLSRREDAAYVAEVIAAWAGRYVGLAAAAARNEAMVPEEEAGLVMVEEGGTPPFGNVIVSGRHVLRADEPVAVGGHDTGPGPYDFLLMALGACTAMTVRMYANHKKLDGLKKVRVWLRHSKIHAEDCADCETREGKVDVIERLISFEGELDDAVKARLMEIADKCPVHRTLHSEIKIRSRLAAD